MSYRKVSRIALVVLTGVLFACSGDQTNPTAPKLDGLASLTGEGKPEKCEPWPACKDDGGGETVQHSYSLTFAGDVIGTTVGTTAVVVNKDENTVGILGGTLADAWLDIEKIIDVAAIDPTTNCFANITHSFTNVWFIDAERGFRAVYVFNAASETGKPLRYTLAMKQNMLPATRGDWPPEAHTATRTLSFDRWEIVHSGRGGKKGACLGAGNFDSQTVTVEHTGDPH